ncbi:hypothetical protein [Tsukamurella pseudospumae]|uniref:hypothetical protein n=1 Tax=Tsukamurella pseudospumae TaxID=239498 RepID=UPI000A69A6AE|nr:hypothetical protein [Tsukamurella pseudospumae]
MTATDAHEGLYKRCSTPRLHLRLYDAWGIAYRAVTCALTSPDAGIEPAQSVGQRYKRRYNEVYTGRYATPAGPNRHIGRTETEMAGRVGRRGRISRIRSSEDIKGGIR